MFFDGRSLDHTRRPHGNQETRQARRVAAGVHALRCPSCPPCRSGSRSRSLLDAGWIASLVERYARQWRVLGLPLVLSLASAACSARGRSPDDVELRHTLPAVHVAPLDAGRVAAPAPASVVHALAWGTFGEADRVTDLQATASGQGTLLVWVTYVDPQAPGRGAARSERRTASVFARPVDADGEALAQPKLISSKAIATGGVALARSSDDKVILGWTGLDAGRAQVFLTQVNAAGDRQAQRMLTRSHSDCSDVALAAAGEGFLVAWVEQRGSSAEVEVARVGPDLVRIGEVRKVAVTQGDASQVRLVARGNDALLAWSEVRASAEQSGIFGVRLAASDGSPRDDVTRLFPVAHPESVRLAPWGAAWVLAWIEGGITRAQTSERGDARPVLRHAALASLVRGQPRDVARVEVAADLTSIALECDSTCHVVASGSRADVLEVHAWAHDPGARRWSKPQSLGIVSGASSEDITPVLIGNWLFFAQDDLNGKGRIGKSRLFWPRNELSK